MTPWKDQETLVRMLEEEILFLKRDGKRVAAEALEGVLGRFRKIESFVDKLKESPPGAWSEDRWEAAKLGSALAAFRGKVMDIKSENLRVISFKLGQKRIGEDGVSQEYLGEGEAELLRGGPVEAVRTINELSSSLPAPLPGYKRMMMDCSLDPYASSYRCIRFRFRDVEMKQGGVV